MLTEIASLSSMVSTAMFIFIHTIFIVMDGYYYCLIPLYLILFFEVYAHRANIVRLINHNENKVHIRKVFAKLSKKNKATNETDDKSN